MNTVEPRAPTGPLDSAERVCEGVRLTERGLRRSHCRVHGPASVVALTPRQRTSLEARQHVHARAWIGAELVPLVAAGPVRGERARRRRSAVLHGHGLARRAGRVVL